MMFKTTENIFKNFEHYFDPNWMNSNEVVYPPRVDWDYSRELQIEDIDLWEVICEGWYNCGVYAAWLPYAEFYLFVDYSKIYITNSDGFWTGKTQSPAIETFYGKNAQKRLIAKMRQYNIPVTFNDMWVENEKMWLYANQ